MTDKQRAAKVLELLAERYPDLETHLMAESPWELLVATVLAAPVAFSKHLLSWDILR